MKEEEKRLTVLLCVLLLKAIFGILFVSYSNVLLNPDEAQYWLWSRFLDFGYYSKPPAIAWQIALGTSFFGSTEIGVRIGGIILSFFLSLSTYYLAKSALLSEKKAFYSSLILAFCPLGIIASFLATTDLGFLLFWILSFKELCLLINEERPKSFIWLGIFILLGCLFKWTMLLIWPVILVSLLFIPNLRNKRLLATFGISLLAFLPTLYWNINHEFATFKHVATQTINSGKAHPFDFFIAQVGLFFPVFFVFLVVSFFKISKQPKSLKFITAWTFVFFFVYMTLAFFKKMPANWVVFAYPLAAVAAGWAISKEWLKWGVLMSIILSLCSLFLPLAQEKDLNIPYSINPLKTYLGWSNLKAALEKSGYDPNKDVLISDRYQTCSLISFYSDKQQRSYCINLGKRRKNQFSYWPKLQKGANGYFVLIEEKQKNALEPTITKFTNYLNPYFEKIAKVDTYPLFSVGGQPVKWAVIFKVEGYTGLEPEEVNSY